jgi:hypothetical protein
MCVQYEFLYLILIRPTVVTEMYLRPALALVVVTLQSKGSSRRLEKILISNYLHPTLLNFLIYCMSKFFILFCQCTDKNVIVLYCKTIPLIVHCTAQTRV